MHRKFQVSARHCAFGRARGAARLGRKKQIHMPGTAGQGLAVRPASESMCLQKASSIPAQPFAIHTTNEPNAGSRNGVQVNGMCICSHGRGLQFVRPIPPPLARSPSLCTREAFWVCHCALCTRGAFLQMQKPRPGAGAPAICSVFLLLTIPQSKPGGFASPLYTRGPRHPINSSTLLSF